jgi:septation ring formation regulator EzrA
MSQSPETEALKKDMDQLRRDLGALTEAFKRNSQQRAQAGVEHARDQFDQVRRQAEGQAEQVGSHTRSAPSPACSARSAWAS